MVELLASHIRLLYNNPITNSLKCPSYCSLYPSIECVIHHLSSNTHLTIGLQNSYSEW